MIKKEDIKVGNKFFIEGEWMNIINGGKIYVANCFEVRGDIAVQARFVSKSPIVYTIIKVLDEKVLVTYSEGSFFITSDSIKANCTLIEGSVIAKAEQVSHPSHYTWLRDLCDVEPLDICRHLDFNTGNAIKYLLRKDKVDGNKTKTEKRIEDLRKAVFYIQDEIKLLEHGTD